MSDEGPSNSDPTKGKGVGEVDPPPGVSAKVLEELEERLVKRIMSRVTAPGEAGGSSNQQPKGKCCEGLNVKGASNQPVDD